MMRPAYCLQRAFAIHWEPLPVGMCAKPLDQSGKNAVARGKRYFVKECSNRLRVLVLLAKSRWVMVAGSR